MAELAGNILFYGDNLDVLRRHVKDETVDFVYLAPPFNSNANYNVLFGHVDGSSAAAQIKAFGDTWHWDKAAASASARPQAACITPPFGWTHARPRAPSDLDVRPTDVRRPTAAGLTGTRAGLRAQVVGHGRPLPDAPGGHPTDHRAAGTSRVTTAPAAPPAPSPMVTPGRIGPPPRSPRRAGRA